MMTPTTAPTEEKHLQQEEIFSFPPASGWLSEYLFH